MRSARADKSEKKREEGAHAPMSVAPTSKKRGPDGAGGGSNGGAKKQKGFSLDDALGDVAGTIDELNANKYFSIFFLFLFCLFSFFALFLSFFRVDDVV